MTETGAPDPAPRAQPDSWTAPSTAPAVPPPDDSVPAGWATVDDVPGGAGAPTYPTPEVSADTAPEQVYRYRPAANFAAPLLGHKPGIVALRPLSAGDVLAGAFSAVRTNVGPVAVYSAVFAAAGALVNLTLGGITALVGTGDFTAATSVGVDTLALTVATAVSATLIAALSGVLAYPTSRAVLGDYPRGARIAATLRSRLPVLAGVAGMYFVLVLIPMAVVGIGLGAAMASASTAAAVTSAVFAVLIVLVLLCLTVRLAFAFPVAVLENCNSVAAMRRSLDLTGPVFGRVLGVTVLTGVIVAAAHAVLVSPVPWLGETAAEGVGGAAGAAVRLVLESLASAVADFATFPFAAIVVTLLYVDARIRLEGLDIALIAAVDGGEAP